MRFATICTLLKDIKLVKHLEASYCASDFMRLGTCCVHYFISGDSSLCMNVHHFEVTHDCWRFGCSLYESVLRDRHVSSATHTRGTEKCLLRNSEVIVSSHSSQSPSGHFLADLSTTASRVWRWWMKYRVKKKKKWHLSDKLRDFYVSDVPGSAQA